MIKKPVLRKEFHCFQGEKTKIMIGLIGTHQGVGVTHTGIVLANYISGVLGNKTAFLEVNMHKDIQKIKNTFDKHTNSFKINKVTYYNSVKENEVAQIFNENYDYFICDFGYEFIRSRNELLRCDKKLVIGSLTAWRREKLFQFVNVLKDIRSYDTWDYLAVFARGKDVSHIGKQLGIKLKGIGYNPDPYELSEEAVRLFRTMY